MRALAKIDLGRAAVSAPGTGFESNLATTRVAAAMFKDKAAKPTVDIGEHTPPPIGRWPTIVGLAIGAAITVAAVMGPAGGDLSSFDADDLWNLMSPPLTQPIDLDVEPRNAKVTLYPGKAGKMLLVVAGEAYNHGDENLTGIEAVAIVHDRGEVEGQRESLVGLTLPEDMLSTIATGPELEHALAEAKRTAAVPIEERALAPGASLPFMVVFPDPPPDLGNRSFHVEFRRASMSAARGE
jgi:hypothetical protein